MSAFGDDSRRCFSVVIWCGFCWFAPGLLQAQTQPSAGWQAGFSRVVITPEKPMWMNGYGNRTKPADGKIHDLYARAAAFRDAQGKTVVMIATDLVGVSAAMTDRISATIQKKYSLPRANLMFTCSHTHCGPALDDRLSYMLKMSAVDWQQVRNYQKVLDRKIIQVIENAIKDLQPGELRFGVGQCGFATNRRVPRGEGPVDHTVPVLAAYRTVKNKEAGLTQKLAGIVFGYACHNTTLGIQQWCGDYAGFAAIDLEEHNPDAVALFFTGCGADANPLPRREIELARMYGRMLSLSVTAALPALKPLPNSVTTGYKTIDLEFESAPSTAELKQTAETGNHFEKQRARFLIDESKELGGVRTSYPYPLQVWEFGDGLVWTALGGEVVVDYAIRLKRELGTNKVSGPRTVWVTGYANDVMAYIPSERILEEGGYEGDTSMLYYQMPSRWKSGLEQQIIDGVKELLQSSVAETRRIPQ